MTQADSVLSTPPTNASADTPEPPADPAGGLYYPTPVTPEEAFQAIGRLRREARDEINRLIGFLDKTDDYVSRELEDSVDDGPMDDNELDGPENGEDEDSDPSEASLGFLERHPSFYGDGRDFSGNQDHLCAGLGGDREDEHDGAEPDDGDAEPSAGYDVGEPSLGWTVAGCMTGPSDDREEGGHAVAPQMRTTMDRNPLTVEVSYRRFLRGLLPAQREAMQQRLRSDGDVSLVGGAAWGMSAIIPILLD